MYNDLGKRKKEIHYAYEEKASGSIVVRYGGGRHENSIIWDHVYSEKGGDYTLIIHYTPSDNRGLDVYVNDMLTDSKIIHLNAGYNKIELTSDHTWMPDIDKIEIFKHQSATYLVAD